METIIANAETSSFYGMVLVLYVASTILVKVLVMFGIAGFLTFLWGNFKGFKNITEMFKHYETKIKKVVG